MFLLFDADYRLKQVQLSGQRRNKVNNRKAFALIIKLRISGKKQRSACLRKTGQNRELVVPLADAEFA